MECNGKRSSYHRRDILKALSAIPAALVPLAVPPVAAKSLFFSCSADNDLYGLLALQSLAFPRYDTPREAVTRAPRGSGVLILAEGYPAKVTELDSRLFQEAAAKDLRLFVEYPSFVPGLTIGTPRHAEWGRYHNVLERTVIVSDRFEPQLKKLQILAIHDCWYVPVAAQNAELVLARVAGFDTSIFGLPKEGVSPILFKAPEGNILVAATKLSQFITGRYAPADAWRLVWNTILNGLSSKGKVVVPEFTPAVRPFYGRHQTLPRDAGLDAFERGAEWFKNAKLFVNPAWKQRAAEHQAVDVPTRGPQADWPVGDGTEGLLEGFSGVIESDGSQLVGWSLRNDCIGETSMAMAFSSLISKRPEDGRIAANLNDFIHFTSPLAKGPRGDPRSPSFGLVGWALPSSLDIYYGDDNARSMLGTMTAAAVLETDRWDEPLLRCLLGNLRTTGRLGFRGDSLEEKQLQQHGWQHFYDADTVNYAPHFEAYLWACLLWAYDKTHYEPFLARAKSALRMTVAAYPTQWRWTNGLQQERARMLLALAWLIRVEDQPEYRQWLKQIAKDLLARQDECGAIREEMGAEDHGLLPPPKSNDRYGTSEAPLIQENGDPVCDLLYTSNFAFVGLHEAAAATGDPFYSQAEDKLAELLCRIQIRSTAHPELHGAWCRAFDFKLWDYWASNSDWGWGPWSIESGWTQAWITSVLAMRHLKTSCWDLTAKSRIARYMEKLLPALMPVSR